MTSIKSDILSLAYEIIFYVRVQNYYESGMRIGKLIDKIKQEKVLLAELADAESPFAGSMSRLLEALEVDDMIWVADLLEEELIPVLKAMQLQGTEEVYGDYSLEDTTSGYRTVKHLPSGFYLHTNCNPMEEARILIEHCYDPQKEKYAVWGIGLGYHIKRLYEKARGAIFITVFDTDKEIVELAKQEGILAQIPEDKLQVIVDEDCKAFSSFLAENDAGILIHFPSVKKIMNPGLKESMHHFFASWNGTIQLKTELAINFRCNEKNCNGNVDELQHLFLNREVVVVAAGPSLDNSIGWLRTVKGEKTIVAVATVLKKLLELGIEPDVVVAMDSGQRTIRQLEGVKNAHIPLIIDSTAYWEFAADYAGKKYIAYQYQYEKAEVVAKEKQYKLYETGGSVTTLALDVVLKSGAQLVYFIGVDMAYPGGISHAKNTMDRSKRDTSGMVEVKSVNGDVVLADSLFIGYRKWIERKIKEYPEVRFYNLSDRGAHIEGTEVLQI